MLELVQPYKSTMPEGIELPTFVPSPEDLASVGLKITATNSEFLKALCNAGVKRLGINKLPNKQVYYDRARYELETLEKLKLVDYMLLVWDFVMWAEKRGIPLGAARGSAAGGLVCYLSGITRKVDPIKYNLYFERFISIDRVQPFEKDGKTYLKDCADIDVDISYFRRPEVLKYLADKYNGNTAKILNIQTMSGKAAIKSSIKIVEEATEDQANAASNKVEKTFGVVAALKDMYDEDEDFRAWADEHKKTYKIARKIENLNKNFSVHASGVAIAAGEMLASFPVQNTKDGETITAWDMEVIGGICVKVDCLGIKTLDLLDICEKESGVLMSSVDPEDPSIYKQFQDLNHKYGLFQVETDAGFRITKMIKPNRFDQLSDIVAINRPGALAALPDYIAYSSGEKPIPKLHPIIDDVLKDTCGVLLMQEQVMRILHEVYKFTLIEANVLRKIIGKKKREEVGAWEEKIKTRGAEVGISTSITDWYWNTIKASADYQFNACLCPETTTVEEKRSGKKHLKDVKIGDTILARDVKRGKKHYVRVTNIFKQKAIVVEVIAEVPHRKDKLYLRSSLDHKYLCADGRMYPLWKVISQRMPVQTEIGDCIIDSVHKVIGLIDTIDLEVDHEDHNFYANGIVVSNSHSRAYSFLTMYCAYYKANFTKQFFLACLKMAKEEADTRDCIAQVAQEMQTFGIKLLPPDLLRSRMDFTVDGDNIRYGLSTIKGVSEKTAAHFSSFLGKDQHDRFSVFVSAKDSGLNIGTLSSLIQAGAFDSLGVKRIPLVYDAQCFNSLTEKQKTALLEHFKDSKESVVDIVRKLTAIVGPNGKPVMKPREFASFEKKITAYTAIMLQNSKYEKFANWYFEKTLLGYSYSEQLSKCFEAQLHNSKEVAALGADEYVRMVGVVKEAKKAESAAGNKYLRVTLSDEFGDTTFMLMNNRSSKKFDQYFEAGKVVPEEDDIYYAYGKKGRQNEGHRDSIIFLETLARVNEKIYFRMRDLDKSEPEQALEQPAEKT